MITNEEYLRYVDNYCEYVGDNNPKCENCKYAMYKGGFRYCNTDMRRICIEQEKKVREEEAKKLLAAFIDDYGKDEAIKLCGDFIENY